MNNKIKISLFVFIPLFAAILEFFLPSQIAALITGSIAFVLGLSFHHHFPKPLKTSIFLLLIQATVFVLIWIPMPRMIDPSEFHIYSSLITFCFFIGLILRKNRRELTFSYLGIFVLGWIVGSAQATFNLKSDYLVSLLTYVFFYGLTGYFLQQSRVGIKKHLLLIAPQLIVAAIEYLTRPSDNWWYGKVLIPVVLIISYSLGCLAAKEKPLSKVPILVYGAFIAWLGFSLLPSLVYQNSWSVRHEKMPAYNLVGLEGDALRSEDLLGKVVWLDVYSTRCGPCIRQMQSLETVIPDYVGKDVRFVSMASVRFDPYERFLKADRFHGFPLWHGYDRDTVLARRYAPSGVPVGLLIDKKGNLRFHKEGFRDFEKELFEAELRAKIDALLAES